MTPEERAAAEREERRRTRRENYATKKAADWRCGECGTTDRVLVVREKVADVLLTRCERHIDRRSHAVQPLQFDERERLEAARR